MKGFIADSADYRNLDPIEYVPVFEAIKSEGLVVTEITEEEYLSCVTTSPV